MKWISFAFILFLFTGCHKDQYEMDEIYSEYGMGTEDAGTIIKKVSSQKVYFGHQSVGNNIIDGIEQWENEAGVQLIKVKSKEFSSVAESPLVHFMIGLNTDPRSKIDEFVELVGQIPDEGDPIAFFKFCYVDFKPDTDVDHIFNYYKEKMHYLKDKYPHIRFAVCTVPLMGIQKGIKPIIKKILGRKPVLQLENIKRDEFNQKLKKEFHEVLPVFDLAGIESTNPDGSKMTFNYKGTDYPFLPDIYTYDLGHLNELGARTISYNLLAFLATEFK